MARSAAKPSARRRHQDHGATRFFEQTLARYRDLTTQALLDFVPADGPPISTISFLLTLADSAKACELLFVLPLATPWAALSGRP